ncbi:50S ribosomal protein L15 [Candidatus Aminicenantes bacterium AC-708-M15]|jgi:large subunit ribosomal protein L15|nr:50S ribosomal protein L15 [SCandidatus Aminicenantes bacterium Aminicenantia_JdfR_composite]MCP2598577.1 50S ribosomal protein L15 [Candidatus Aminicenantes bacterium AC-335-L06]MCP2604079.1 50S ribosomal protein L15 [Candidatus Aminicenantes bacterium AC-708-M15]MCP2605368.1 50S ribosomal protein L15 [Candidatus Aminicenantes bacterium AC-335-O07]MCP2606021.1 50S ribosomal protein L15 [Candidatus Aminicenantes bacterium AC-708-I09]MCP2617865.1 50S ribosomal protein L15 [Candidatus Aminicen
MNLSNLKPAKGSRKNRKRVGRGPGSGHGKTACRGHKGQKSRSGHSLKRGFEGGQMPLHRRVPKRGFTSPFKEEYQIVNLDRISEIPKKEIKLEDLKEAGLIKKLTQKVKILARGEISSAKKIYAHSFSESAKEKIEKAGGQAIIIGAE